MWAVVRYVLCFMICGLLYDCMMCGLLYVMWAVVLYEGCCMLCGLFYGMWAIVYYVRCCMI